MGWLSKNGLNMTGANRNNLIETLEGRAAARPVRDVFFRVANGGTKDAPEIHVNLMDGEGNAVSIDASGWRIVKVEKLPLPLAHRESGLPLPLPVATKDGVSFLERLGRHIPFLPILRQGDPRDAGV